MSKRRTNARKPAKTGFSTNDLIAAYKFEKLSKRPEIAAICERLRCGLPLTPEMVSFSRREPKAVKKASKFLGVGEGFSVSVGVQNAIDHLNSRRHYTTNLATNVVTLKANVVPLPDYDPYVSAIPDHSERMKFYSTTQWKHLRYRTIKERGARCECCGSTPKDGITIMVDHIKPVSKAWHLRADPTNLQVLCDLCNCGKGGHDQTDWREQA